MLCHTRSKLQSKLHFRVWFAWLHFWPRKKRQKGENQTQDIKEQPHTLTNQSLTTVLAQIPDTAKPSSAGWEELTHWTA